MRLPVAHAIATAVACALRGVSSVNALVAVRAGGTRRTGRPLPRDWAGAATSS